MLALLILRVLTRQQRSQGCFCDKASEGRKQSNDHVSQAYVPGGEVVEGLHANCVK